MIFRPLAMYTLVCVIAVVRVSAADAGWLRTALDEAERIRATDKQKARQLLGSVERERPADPEIVARVQLLECKWADAPAVAYRAAELGLASTKAAALRARLIGCRASALMTEGKAVDAEREFGTAAAMARQTGNLPLQAEALENIGYLQYSRGAMADALTNVQAAYRLSAQLGDEKGRLEALSMIANVYADANVAQYDRALEYYRQLLGDYEKRQQPSDVADTLFNIASTLEAKGDFRAAELHYRRALASFQKLGQAKDVAFTKRALGSALMKQGHAPEALPLLDEALSFYEKTHDAENVAFVRQFRGMAFRRVGRLPEALVELDAARVFFEGEKNVRFLEKNAEETALVYSQLGDWRKAYDASVRHSALSQQLAAARRDELSSRLRVAFDSEKKDQENRALARENGLR